MTCRDAAVANHYRVDQRLCSAHGRRVGPAKAVAVELAAQLVDMSGRAIGAHYGIGATAVRANRERLVSRPDVLQVAERLGRELRKTKSK